jgi:hypothetical protein
MSFDFYGHLHPLIAYFRVNLIFPFIIILLAHLTNRRLFLVFHAMETRAKWEEYGLTFSSKQMANSNRVA